MGGRHFPRRARPGSPADWHVVMVVENIPLGADHRLRKQLETLLAHGCRVTVISPRHDVNGPYRGRQDVALLEYVAAPELRGPIGHVVEYAWSGVAASLLLLRLRLRGRVDVVQLCQPPDIYFPLARLLRRAGARVVVDQRDLMPELLVARYPRAPGRAIDVLHLLERRTQRAVDHTITVNEHLRRRLEEAGGDGNVSVVWNGPVLARVDGVRPAPELRGAGDRLVVWVGKMGVQDRVELVVEVADAVIRSRGRRDLRFVLIGDGECLEDLRALVRRRGLDDRVTFTGWVPEETVFRYLATADAGIDTSLQEEVTPVKALEYMSFGLAFAAFDLAETRRLAGEAAVLAAPGDVDALAQALVELIDDEQRRRVLGRAGRRRVQESLSWERQEPAYLAAVGPTSRPSRSDRVRGRSRRGPDQPET
ncbi:MAG TPA: glycosyltransferase family 4 protein [Nocardioides sp.]|jgi:glycosyltransferase involved in cell wall biosynthesis|nr:glycosyltransferase family 4 protein [Nocardioides sp.]